MEIGRELQRLGLDGRSQRRHGFADDDDEVDRPDVQAQHAGDDAGDIEEVVDDLGLSPRIALDRLQRIADGRRVKRPRSQHAGPSDDRRQRCAQLVRDRGQELVLGPAGLLSRAIEPRIVDGLGGTTGQVLGEGEVSAAVTASRFGRAERDAAQPAAPRVQRHHHDRAQTQSAKGGAVLGIGCDRVEHLIRDLGMELRLPGPQDLREAVSAEVDRLVVGQLAGELDVGGVDVGGGEPADSTVFLEHIDRAQIGQPGHDQTGNLGQRGLVVE